MQVSQLVVLYIELYFSHNKNVAIESLQEQVVCTESWHDIVSDCLWLIFFINLDFTEFFGQKGQFIFYPPNRWVA